MQFQHSFLSCLQRARELCVKCIKSALMVYSIHPVEVKSSLFVASAHVFKK